MFEDGIEQKVTSFLQFIGGRWPAPSLPSNDARRLVMILVDDLNTPVTELAGLRTKLESIRDTVLRDDDLVGVVSTGYASISIDQQYDRGHMRLNQAIAKLAAAEQAGTLGAPALADAERRARVALTTATDLLAGAAKVTGLPKAMIYVGGYMNPRVLDTVEADFIRVLAEIIRAANRAGVAFFPVAAQLFPVAPNSVHDADGREYVEKATTTLRTLAEETAGRAVVPNEPSIYYLIGYTSSNHDLSKPTRRIEIQTTRPGIQLDYRRAYTIK